MNIQYAFEHINQKVFKTIHLENIAINEANNIKNTYPYFIFVRYILAYKDKELFQNINITFEAALQRDPLWFGYVLEHMDKKSEIPNTNFYIKNSIYHAHTSAIYNEKIALPMLDVFLPNPKKDTPKPLAKNNEVEISIVDENVMRPIIDAEAIFINKSTTQSSKYENTVELPIIDEIPEFSSNSPTLSDIAILVQEDETIIATPNKTTTPFMPLHVEDYFGALNINVKESTPTTILPITKPSKNQKPFMDWLDDFSHTYKKNNLGYSEKNDTPVASETMAEIWVAENRYDKAINTYEKLSLLFPEKSVYFAQKISELKNTLKISL